jgi:hypothetical protein
MEMGTHNRLLCLSYFLLSDPRDGVAALMVIYSGPSVQMATAVACAAFAVWGHNCRCEPLLGVAIHDRLSGRPRWAVAGRGSGIGRPPRSRQLEASCHRLVVQ